MKPVRRGTPDFLLLFLSLALVAFGLLMVFSASSMTAVTDWGDPWYYVKKQAIAIFLGMIGMFVAMNIHYSRLKKWVLPAFFACLILLFLVPFFGTGPKGMGVHSWFRVGPFNLQPSEFAKLGVIMYLALYISRKGERFRQWKGGLLPALIMLGLIALLIMLQPDLGSCVILVLSALIVVVAGGARMKHLFGIAMAAALIIGLIVGMNSLRGSDEGDYRIDRFTAFLNPFSDENGIGYQLVQSLYAFGHGGVTGAGFGQSIQKLHYLPEPHNDFIFAIIGEEFGFIGSSLFLLVFVFFLWRGILVSVRCKDQFSMLVGIGVMGMFGIQAFINIGGVTGAIPMTGVTLPFISYGGSSIIATLLSTGVMLGISREQNKQDAADKPEQPEQPEQTEQPKRPAYPRPAARHYSK